MNVIEGLGLELLGGELMGRLRVWIWELKALRGL